MGFEMVKLNVIDKLKAKYNGLYTHDNVIISGTHTHSTPGGVGGTILVDLTTFGYIPQNHRAAVTGIVKAIVDAHESRALGDIYVKTGILDGANINRSPSAYLNDPIKERADYKHDTDHLDTIVRFDLDDGTEIGVIDFFAVHGVSMNNTNTLVSGDNKGVASALFEKAKNPKGTLIGEGNFVAAFGQTNEGDVSPNTAGPSCPDGSPCDGVHSTCGGYAQGCTAKGPGKDMFESTLIIGKMQFDSAYDLYHAVTAEDKLKGPVDYRHTFTEMQNLTVDPAFTATGEQGETCEAGLGFSFAGGTTDGPGEFDFTQGVNRYRTGKQTHVHIHAHIHTRTPTLVRVNCGGRSERKRDNECRLRRRTRVLYSHSSCCTVVVSHCIAVLYHIISHRIVLRCIVLEFCYVFVAVLMIHLPSPPSLSRTCIRRYIISCICFDV